MENNEMKRQLDHALKTVAVHDDLKRQILKACEQDEKPCVPIRERRRRAYRPILIAAAVLLSIAVPITALGATIPAVNDIIAVFSEKFAHFLMPVRQQSKVGDFTMTVLDSCFSSDAAFVTYSIQKDGGFRSEEEMRSYLGGISFNLYSDQSGRNVSGRGTAIELMTMDWEAGTAVFLCYALDMAHPDDLPASPIGSSFTLKASRESQTSTPDQAQTDQTEPIQPEPFCEVSFQYDPKSEVLEKELDLTTKCGVVTRVAVMPAFVIVRVKEGNIPVQGEITVQLSDGRSIPCKLDSGAGYVGLYTYEDSRSIDIQGLETINPQDVVSVNVFGTTVEFP
ncbi:hypothetical protein [Candidatus Soleaferrea massiliensis]|uniref:hypothetical protein n=1 Tax=Candidatus Soleaferrea massiliensis TaxID=1470354 RepID=UPI00058E27FE|nr:hypothetical protein [Candidatus Soleaferrea massiliensis]